MRRVVGRLEKTLDKLHNRPNVVPVHLAGGFNIGWNSARIIFRWLYGDVYKRRQS